MRRYLVDNRGVESNQVVMIEAGFREKFTVEIWFVPAGKDAPKLTPTIAREKVRFEKGEFPSWEEPGCFADESQRSSLKICTGKN